ncbi:MAG: hypothetical protein ACI4I5_09750 [Acutalibacteraceae bacterium]
MKKGLSVILIIALVASLAGVLGACGGKGENDATTESTEQTTASPWKDLLEDFTYDYEDESYTERTTDEHYEQEYEALTLPSANPTKAASANATTAATTKANATRVTTTKAFMFTSPSQPSTTKKTETTAASGSTTATTASTTQATTVTDSTSMTDNIAETNVGFGGNVTEGGSPSRPQVTYLDKYVVDVLAGSSYTLQVEMKAEGKAVPFTNYKDGSNSATKVRLSALAGADIPKLGGLDEVRVVIKDSKLYIAWAGGYVQMVDQDMEDVLNSMKDMDIREMLRTDALEYVGAVSGTGYVCESYRIPEENLGYSFYFTSNGISRVEVVDLETRQVVETMSISLKAGVSDKNAFTLSGKKYTMEEFEQMFEGMAG